MTWAGRKVFVTGADGFIGSHLCEALRDAGARVTGLAHYNSFDRFGWLDEVEGVEKRRGDIRDTDQQRILFGDAEVVFHLAALGSVPYSKEAPLSVIQTNVLGTYNVIQAARHAGAKLVHVSTSEVYGTALTPAQDETHPRQRQSVYAATKDAGDGLVEAFARQFGLDAAIVRPFNTYGPRQSRRAVIPQIIIQALGPGREIRLGSLLAARDWTYVNDTARALMDAASLDDIGPWNVGTGEAARVEHIVNSIQAEERTCKTIVHDPSRLRPIGSEVERLCCDSAKFRAATGWAPEVSFDDGLAKTIAWWRQRDFRKGRGYIT